VPTQHRNAIGELLWIKDSGDHSESFGSPLPTRLVSVGAVGQLLLSGRASSTSGLNMAVIYLYISVCVCVWEREREKRAGWHVKYALLQVGLKLNIELRVNNYIYIFTEIIVRIFV